MIIWSLFDSGNGCYNQVFSKKEGVTNYSVGIDKGNSDSTHIELDLADLSYYFGSDDMIKKLEQYPKPDVIIASPPCESWSVASAMTGGNACWRKVKGGTFGVRYREDYEGTQFKQDKSFYNRINGELTIYNLIRIIKHFEPKIYIIENPAYGRIWEYIEDVIGFSIPYENLTYYNNYDYPVKKPTKFKSNIYLELKTDKVEQTIEFRHLKGKNVGGRYNLRSNIPLLLIEDIYDKIESHLKEEIK